MILHINHHILICFTIKYHTASRICFVLSYFWQCFLWLSCFFTPSILLYELNLICTLLDFKLHRNGRTTQCNIITKGQHVMMVLEGVTLKAQCSNRMSTSPYMSDYNTEVKHDFGPNFLVMGQLNVYGPDMNNPFILLFIG